MAQEGSIRDTLDERGKTHGRFVDNAKVSQKLKLVLLSGEKRHEMIEVEDEALDMICHKMSRIVSGNPHEPDHWRDIAGYAQLVVDILTESEHQQLSPTHSSTTSPGLHDVGRR